MITAQSKFGTATCTYNASLELVCAYDNDMSAATDNNGLWVPVGTTYTVDESGLPEGWTPKAGLGEFEVNPENCGGDLQLENYCWHTVENHKEPSTAVTLISFSVEAGSGGTVTLAWETASEIDNAGFNLYRATAEAGPYAKVNDSLITALGNTNSGASYSFLDAPGTGKFYYKLEDVDYYGISMQHDPVTVTTASAFRRPMYRPLLPVIALVR